MTNRERTSPEGTSQPPQKPVDDPENAPQSSTEEPEPSIPLPTNDLTNGERDDEHEVPDPDFTRDDSEAETVLSSPVKRKEALRRANGIKSEPKDNHISIDAAIHAASPSLQASVQRDDSADTTPSAPELRVTIDAASPAQAVTSRDANDNSDGDSELSEPDSAKSRTPSASPKLEEDGTDSRTLSNPKKRKLRDSSLGQKRASAEVTKRQRRSSAIDQANSEDENSVGASSPPRQRRHRRTRSSQLVDDLEEDSPEQNLTGRSRRAASSRPTKEEKAVEPDWDSDSESEDTALPSQSRSRGAKRSASATGRPGGREHKRHVNKYGFTRLAEACEDGDMDAVQEWLEKDRGALEVCEFAGNSPLQIASLNGYPDIVKYLLDNGCNKDCANSDNDTPLIDAVENGHTEVVKVLLAAGVDPLHQNRKGQQALDVITDEVEDAAELRDMLKQAIEKRLSSGIVTTPHMETEEERTDRLGPKQVLHFMARTPENLLKLVANNDRKGVIEFLNARVPVDNNIVAAAAKTGDLYLLNLLLVDMNPRKAKLKAEKPMLGVLGSSHFEVVKVLTEVEHFDPLWKSKANGMTWFETAEERNGPHWKQERDLLHRLYKEAQRKNRLSSSPVAEFKHGTKRQKSPAPSKESDAEAEEPESPDTARGKRRLISRKKLRVSASRKSLSVEPSGPSSSPEAVTKTADVEEPASQTRKTGRARTKSFLTQVPEGKARRIKATRENIALFDSARDAGNKSRKPSTSSNSRPAAESVNAAKKNGVNGDDDTTMTDTKAEEERAEKARQEEEQLKRENEAREVEKQQRLEQRASKLEAIPSALRHGLEMQSAPPTKLVTYLASHFLPLQAVSGSTLGFEGAPQDGPWMLSYQAAGLLRGAAADELLDIPSASGDVTAKAIFVKYGLHAVRPEDRKAMQMALGSVNLADHMPPIYSTDLSSPTTDNKQEQPLQDFRSRIVLETQRFAAMQPLSWLRVRDFLAVKAELQINQPDDYGHLAHLPPLEIAFDTCLDGGGGRFGSPAGTPLRTVSGKGVLTPKGSPAGTVVDEDLRVRIGQGLKEGDGRSNGMFNGGVRRVTQVAVVVE